MGVCVKPFHVALPLPVEERGLLTSSWSGLTAGQNSVLTSKAQNNCSCSGEKEVMCEHVCCENPL